MPQYLFLDELTNKIEEVFFKFADAPSIGTYIEYENRKLRRLATIPNASSDSVAVDPYSSKDFARITNKGGTIGELWDRSAEMSEKRKDKDGIDPVMEKHLAAQEKKTGRKSLHKKNREATEKLKAKGIIIE